MEKEVRQRERHQEAFCCEQKQRLRNAADISVSCQTRKFPRLHSTL
jgi:hypothetical protein